MSDLEKLIALVALAVLFAALLPLALRLLLRVRTHTLANETLLRELRLLLKDVTELNEEYVGLARSAGITIAAAPRDPYEQV